MPEKDPTTWSIATWALIIGMSIMGGITRLLVRVRNCGFKSISLVIFFSEIATSGLVGVVTFMTLISFDYPVSLCAAASGICAHMSTRLIFLSLQITDKVAWAIGKKIESSVDNKDEL